MFSIRLGSFLVAVMLGVLSVTSEAKAVAQDTEASLNDLLACDKIKNPNDKLNCFNAVVAILKQEKASGGGASSRPKATQKNFGFQQKDIDRRNRKSKRGIKKKFNERTFGIQQIWKNAIGKYYFLLDNGQLWKETDGSRVQISKKAKEVRIKKSSFGGYRAYFKGKKQPANVKRIR